MDDLENLDESQQNRLLRRADWRYLLANPKPKKSICFTDRVLKQAVRAISSSLVSSSQFKTGECDLAVASNPTQAVLNSAFHALCSDGEIYTEWYSPLAGGARGVRHRLEHMGFTDVICYWTWPPPIFTSPSYWLPLDSPRALRHFFSNRPKSSSIAVRIARVVLRMILVLGLHDRLLIPVYATARKPLSRRPEGFRANINAEIIRHWKSWGFDRTPSKFVWLLQTPGYRMINKIIVSVFSENDERPELIVKIPRSNISAQALATEADNLESLSKRNKLSPKGTPRLLFRLNWKGILTVGEAFVDGEPIYTRLNHNNYRELALKVTDWLIELARGTEPSPRLEWWDQIVDTAITDFVHSFGSVFTRQELSCIHTILNTLNVLPIVFEQRDCSPWNILLNEDDEITVLDWESSVPHGLPALDLIYFVTYLSFFLEGAMESGQYLKVYRNARNPETFIGQVNQECHARYCARINIDPAALRPLHLLTWLIHSRYEHRRLTEDAAGAPTPDALRASLFSRLVREEIRLADGASQNV